MAAANKVSKLIVGRDGLLSTPAASHLIRHNRTDGGFILSASHNPGGIDADFGLKFNMKNGGPASESTTNAIFDETTKISRYLIGESDDINLASLGEQSLGGMIIEIVDPVVQYQALMESLFDFPAIKALFAGGFSMRFDAMHAVTGPYARAILEDTLGAADGTVLNGSPSEDFGNGHPDPNPVWAKSLMDLMMSDNSPDFGAASDGDGDRNMIVGRNIYVTPSDSLAVLAANAHLAPGYAGGLKGIARSMPTSCASDLVAQDLRIECFETPTGWKYFGNLLDAGRATICGEESAGTGSDHVREKDGLWAVLLWLNILAKRKQSVAAIMQEHWRKFGRNYYSRHDYEDIPSEAAEKMFSELEGNLAELAGKTFCGEAVVNADVFSYLDPVDHSVSDNQGIRIFLASGGRAVFRLSGTGTQGAILRVYLEQYVPGDGDLAMEPQTALETIANAAREIIALETHTGRVVPDVIT